MEILLGTLTLRPYVFVFLAIYLLGASGQFGSKPTFVFLPLGYLVAFLSELCSINWGFPYGDYYYIEATRDKELWIMGVPFMDSISYVFIAACSYSTALFLMTPVGRSNWEKRAHGEKSVWILASLFMVLLDVVVDPVALRGEKWFLGKIYGYREEGAYFGVPMSNFVGWLFVAIIMTKIFQSLVGKWGKRTTGPWWNGIPIWSLWGPALYLGIIAFNLAVTYWIGEFTLAIASTFIAGTFFFLALFWTVYKIRHRRHG